MSNSSIFFRFLKLSHAITDDILGIDLTALRLLESIAIAHTKNATLNVTAAIALNTIASPATLHRKLDALREAGLIEQEFEGKNRRTKYLIPTRAAGKYFENMGKALSKSARQDA